MTSSTSVGGDERLRLFLGLRLRAADLDAVEAWQREHLERMRVVPRAHLHVTLAFLGHRPAGELPAILEALRAAAGATYVFAIRSLKGHPDARSGDFRPISFPYGSALVYTRTFHAS